MGLPVLVKRAQRAALGMVGAALVLGSVLVVLAPLAAVYITGPDVPVERLAVAGWVLYVAGSASCQPFASLAAAQGRPAAVFLCRCIDATAALAVVRGAPRTARGFGLSRARSRSPVGCFSAAYLYVSSFCGLYPVGITMMPHPPSPEGPAMSRSRGSIGRLRRVLAVTVAGAAVASLVGLAPQTALADPVPQAAAAGHRHR